MTSTVVVSVAVITLALLVLGAGVVAAFAYLRSQMPEKNVDGTVAEGFGARLAAVEIQVQGLPSLWEDERNRAKRDADSARKARKVAEDKLEEVEELIEAGLEPGGENATRSDQVEMQPMSTRLGDPPASDRRERVEAVAHLLR